jgi:hypothetical protein
MCGNAIPTKVITLRVVTKHIPSKPKRDHSSKHEQERGNVCNRLNKKGVNHLRWWNGWFIWFPC